ncbi:MAG: hypothetical protein KDK26_02125 [Roseivivax sp.]|nr:hypothetical protein [Roseivivax sp.]
MEELFGQLGLPEDLIEVRFVKGKPQFAGYIGALMKDPAFTSGRLEKVCVVVDADADHAATSAEMVAIFSRAGVHDVKANDFVTFSGVRVGLFVLPGDGLTGELEDIVINSNFDDPRFIHARDSLVRFQSGEENWRKHSKRVVQIALALSRIELCAGVGRGLRNNAFNITLDATEEFNEFVSRFLGE